ncbi:hypothetical protein Slin15195_G022620 [Septoria linicola]|uniref:Uncharacterized protein n=1 Tax=Septoria linicola TaxID=215465 RepID=A0A9Q9AMQ6_9PEZI|nr:hypothetical protein Slin14017_G021660 [Septoria linicola]USW48943.1 hypothetical protein Slin15195_G022620 [Septoria linicola]
MERKVLKVVVCAPPCGHFTDVLFEHIIRDWCALCTPVMLEQLQKELEPKEDEKAYYLRKGYSGPKKQ